MVLRGLRHLRVASNFGSTGWNNKDRRTDPATWIQSKRKVAIALVVYGAWGTQYGDPAAWYVYNVFQLFLFDIVEQNIVIRWFFSSIKTNQNNIAGDGVHLDSLWYSNKR